MSLLLVCKIEVVVRLVGSEGAEDDDNDDNDDNDGEDKL
jgi:hypothetical protein